MKNTKAALTLLAALALTAALFCFALADGVAIEGQATGEVVFYAYPQTGTSLTFTQEKGTVISTGGMRSTVYGGYDITWYPTAQPYSTQTASMTGRTVTIQLSRGVAYTVRVIPWTLDRVKNRDAYLGLPGTYERWATPSEWLLTGSAGCLTGFAPYGAMAVTATPVPTAVPWYFAPTASPVTAEVYVFYRQLDGKLITYTTESLTPGTHVITSKLNGSYFSPLGNTVQTVYVSGDGTASPASVTFYYQYNGGSVLGFSTPVPTAAPTPTPAPVTAAVEILYRQTDGALLFGETRLLSEGTHMISYDNRFDGFPWLTFLGPAAYNVSVYADGAVSVPSVTFYFSSNAGYVTLPVGSTPSPSLVPTFDESATNQEALIGAEKIFPRPQPGKGKNTFNYEAVGQKVTVHSKALSLTNDGSWWVCISANLRCWGQTYVIDHQWIKSTYLNPNSYDLAAVPMDPKYQ